MSEASKDNRAKTEKKKSSLGQRTVTGAILIAALVVVLHLGGWVFAVTVLVCLGLALYEELHALCAAGHAPVWWPSFAALAVSMPLMMFFSTAAMIPILTLLSFCALFCVMRRRDPDLIDIEMSLLPMLSIVLPGMCLFGILGAETRVMQTFLLVLVFAVAVGGDTFAYFVGSIVGGPKLCPHISPNKTVAGCIGGLLGSVFCALVTGWLFGAFHPGTVFPPFWGNILVGLVGGVAGQMGDLFASMVKRHCKIKDFSHIFPGHGGMMDRMDSIVFVAIIIFSYRVILRV